MLNTIRSEAVPLPGLPAVAVHAVRDTRQEGTPYQVGISVYTGPNLKRDFGRRETPTDNDEPVASTVARAMVVGLVSRGFSVIDLRTTVYAPSSRSRETRFGIAAELQEFWFRAFYSNRDHGGGGAC